MNKLLKFGIISFLILFMIALIMSIISKKNNKQEIVEDVGVFIDIEEDINKVVKDGVWHDITEEDKITLALSVETEIISILKNYLKDNKIAIFFVYGGPFDYELKGNYIICTGFNEDGKAKILYPNDNFEKEWKYSFEGLIEFSQKVMLFEM